MSLRNVSGIIFHNEVFWCAIFLNFWLAAFELTSVKPRFLPLDITKIFKELSWNVYLFIAITEKKISDKFKKVHTLTFLNTQRQKK